MPEGKRPYLSGLKITGIIDILQCTKCRIRFTDLTEKTQIRFRVSFLAYLRFCVDKRLVENHTTDGSEFRDEKKYHASWYTITKRGTEFLELVS